MIRARPGLRGSPAMITIADMERVPLESKAVASVGYDDGERVLEIEFASGRVYRYANVPRSVYDWLLKTPAKGAYVARMIANRYEYCDVTPAPADVQDLDAALRASLDARREPPGD